MLYRLWCFDFEWLIAFDKFFSIKSRMEACPRLDMFPQPSFVCAQESSSLGLAVKKLIRVRQLTFFLSFMFLSFPLSIIFFVPSVTIQWKSRRFPKWSHNVYILEKWILCEDNNKQWYWIEKFEKILLPISIFPKSIQSSG